MMEDSDPSNPGGETLASDPIAVSLSSGTVAGGKLVLTVYWDAIPGAKAYRVYRSPNGTENLDGVRMVAIAGILSTYSSEFDGNSLP
jgi:hypothetical protein